jgi:hypothetical protein
MLSPVVVSGQQFVLTDTGESFIPFGFNYDHDENYRLLEEYWHTEWNKVERDFLAMQALGANTVRIHLQAGHFLAAPDAMRDKELQQLDRLLALAASLSLRLHIVGLGCYHPKTIPVWYAQLAQDERWRVQTFFWHTLAVRYRHHPAVFCFDLMNEPLVPARCRRERGWLGQDYHGSHFTQYIALDGTPASRSDIAQRWTHTLVSAIHNADPQRLVTIGLVDWSLPHCKPSSGFVPEYIAPLLDFVCLHIYPESGKVNEAVDVVKQFCLGKPLLIDESFPLKCEMKEFDRFLTAIQPMVNGVLGFYTDQVAEPRTDHHHIRNRAMHDWLQIFAQQRLMYRCNGEINEITNNTTNSHIVIDNNTA